MILEGVCVCVRVTLHMLRASHALLLRGATTVMSYVVACLSEPRTCQTLRATTNQLAAGTAQGFGEIGTIQ
jgi:hypothetical protein